MGLFKSEQSTTSVEPRIAVMPTKHNGSQTRDFPVVRSMPLPLDVRLGRIEDLLLEMRHEQDVLLKRLTKAQAQIDTLATKSPRLAPTGFVELRQQSQDREKRRK